MLGNLYFKTEPRRGVRSRCQNERGPGERRESDVRRRSRGSGWGGRRLRGQWAEHPPMTGVRGWRGRGRAWPGESCRRRVRGRGRCRRIIFQGAYKLVPLGADRVYVALSLCRRSAVHVKQERRIEHTSRCKEGSDLHDAWRTGRHLLTKNQWLPRGGCEIWKR